MMEHDSSLCWYLCGVEGIELDTWSRDSSQAIEEHESSSEEESIVAINEDQNVEQIIAEDDGVCHTNPRYTDHELVTMLQTFEEEEEEDTQQVIEAIIEFESLPPYESFQSSSWLRQRRNKSMVNPDVLPHFVKFLSFNHNPRLQV